MPRLIVLKSNQKPKQQEIVYAPVEQPVSNGQNLDYLTKWWVWVSLVVLLLIMFLIIRKVRKKSKEDEDEELIIDNSSFRKMSLSAVDQSAC